MPPVKTVARAAEVSGHPQITDMIVRNGYCMAVTLDMNFYAASARTRSMACASRRVSISAPTQHGSEQVRDVGHNGTLMVLRPPLRTYAGWPPEQRVLYWERLSEVDG